jgi:cytochrome c-type biogenesis protein CcmH
MKIIRTIFVMLMLISALQVNAKEAESMAKDPVLEARVMEVSEELRCLVCQNQTIADSDADLAVDLRNQVREMLAAGKTEKEIIDFMVQRYGDFVRYRPPMKSTTYLLWFGPFILVALGLLILIYNLKRRQKLTDEAELSEEDHRKVQELLEQESRGEL